MAFASASRARSRSVALLARLRNTGATVQSAFPSVVSQITFAKSSANGTLLAYKSAGKTSLAVLRKQGVARVYAVEGDALVVVQGDATYCNKRYVAEIMKGLPVESIAGTP